MVLGIIRTSTIYQEIQSQKDELEKFIQNDTSEDYVIIGKQGASAQRAEKAREGRKKKESKQTVKEQCKSCSFFMLTVEF